MRLLPLYQIIVIPMLGNLNIYKLIFENAREGLLLTDNRGIIELVNPRLIEIFKYAHEHELVGKPIEILIPRELRRKHVQHRINYYQGPKNRAITPDRPLVGSCKDDSRIFLEVSLSHFHNEDGEIKVLSSVNDITQNVQTKQALEKEKELNELKSRFVSMVSHEIRTPLSSIHSSAILISKYKEAFEQVKREKHTEKIKRAVKELTSLLEDVLSLQRMEEDVDQPRLERLRFPEVIQDFMSNLFLSDTERDRIRFIHTGKKSFYTDKQIIGLTLKNLLLNALKYSPNKSKIQVLTKCTSKWLYIKVRDRGMGIPEMEQAKIFDRFYRASNAAHIKGTGLGLSIVKGMLEKLSADIVVDSIPGEFTEFTVMIPSPST